MAAIIGALLLVLTPVAYAAVTGVVTSGSTFKTDSGLSVQVQQNQSLSGNPFIDDQTFSGDGGNVSAMSSGDGYLEITDWGESDTDTVVGNVSLESTGAAVDPDSNEPVIIRGSANEVSWGDYTPGDGVVDFTASVGTSDSLEISFFNLGQDATYEIVDTNGNVIERVAANSQGILTVTVNQSGSFYIKPFDNAVPSVTDLSPNAKSVSNTVTLSAKVDDDTLPEANVTVTFRVDGQQVHQTDISSAGEVNYTLTQSELPNAGSHTWSASAKDQFGATTTESASFVVPGNITVRNISQTSQVVPNATATVYTGSGSTEIEADANGNLSLEGLPANQQLVMDISAPDYETRTTTIPSIVQAEDAYLIPNGTDTVTNRFTLNDPTGEFDSDSVVYVERPVELGNETEWRTVAGDQFGVEGSTAILETGQRYRLRIVSDSGAVAQMGKYTADTSQEVPLRPQSPTVELTGEGGVAYNATATDQKLTIQYVDPLNQTDVLTVSVVNRFNESDYLLGPQTYYGTNSLMLSEPLGGDGLQDSYVVLLEGQRDGESFAARIPIGPEQIVLVPGGLSQVWVQIAGIGSLLLVAGVFSRLNVGVGVVATSLLGGIWWFIGLLPGVATWATVALAITFSVIYAMVVQR